MVLRILVAAMVLQASALVQQKNGVAKENPFCIDGHVAPSVFLMGYQKSGSTSLWNDLKDNFHLAPAKPVEGEDGFRDKEVSYFSNDQRYTKGKHFYLKHFPTCSALKQGKSIDASPNTIFGGEKTAKRVKEFYGEKAKDLKFIIIARDATSRMESAYWHFQSGLDGNFDKYVAKTLPQAKLWAAGKGEAPEPNLYYPNMYIKHIKPWLAEFSPEQFAFMTLEQYDNQHGAAMKHLSRRLKISGKSSAGVYQNHKREHPNMKSQTKKELDDFYTPYMKELGQLVQESQIGFGDDPVRKMMQSSSLLQTESVSRTVEHMDADTEALLRLHYGHNQPTHNYEVKITPEVDEKMGGPMDYDEKAPEMSSIDIDFELNGDAAHP